jgi:hypothetical protein
VNLANTLRLQNLKAANAGAQATVADSRSADEWVKRWLDDKNRRLNDLRARLHNLLDHPPALDEYLRPEIKAAYRNDKNNGPKDQMPGRVAGTGNWAVVSPEGEIISRWPTKAEADAAAWPAWRGIKPSATGASGGARVVRLRRVSAADIFEDVEHGDKTRRKFLKKDKPQIVKDADILRLRDRRPSSHGQGSAGTGGAGAGGAGGGVGI